MAGAPRKLVGWRVEYGDSRRANRVMGQVHRVTPKYMLDYGC
jgi:hypothetical protein